VGEAGAANAGLFAVAMLARDDAKLAKKLEAFRARLSRTVRAMKLPGVTGRGAATRNNKR
jgi:5-(carboxyamino)imidazole ribonucleotide mutase